MQTKADFTNYFLAIGIAQWFYLIAPFLTSEIAPPISDDCATPSQINITDNGFATGTFSSETIEITEATVVFGEYFDQSQVLASNDKKSIWYQFYLPTAREVKIELFQPSNDIEIKDAGFSTFYSAQCLPRAAELTAAKLTPLPKFGSTSHPCLAPGFYLIQVSAAAEAEGAVFLQLDITPSFTNDNSDVVNYDFPIDAYNFGRINDNQNHRVNYDFGCHSIDNGTEFNCLPVANPSEYTQSSWHTFTTNNHVDLVNIEVQSNRLPDTLGYRLYKGDVRQNTLADLEIVEECSLFNNLNGRRAKEHSCELDTNTVYSFQLIFHQDYFNENLRVQIRERGVGPTAATLPVFSPADSIANMDLLAQNEEGITTAFVDNFACNARLELPQNQCDSLQNAIGVYNPADSNIIYDLVNWMTFETASSAEVQFDFKGYGNYRYIRLYEGGFSNDCQTFQASSNIIFENSFRDFTLQCLAAGQYSMQFLGSSEHPNQKNNPDRYYPLWDDGNLGRTISLDINVKSIQAVNRFSLKDSFAIDLVNQSMPLKIDTTYQMAADTFGCGNTVIPAGGTCENREKAIYRTFNIGDGNGDMRPDSGMIRITNMNTRDNRADIHYKLFEGNLQESTIAQSAFQEGDTLRNVNNYLEGCITDNHNRDRGYYCVVPNDYTLTSFGGDAQRNESDQPNIYFKVLNTKYISRLKAEDLGDITDTTAIMSAIDVFSCLDNPDTLGGLAPCGGTTKLIYRQFYLDETKITRIRSIGAGTIRLYQGQANDLADELVPWDGLKANNTAWTSCFSNQKTSDCLPLTAGWYTIVTYGSGASYDRPSMGGSNGVQNDLGKDNQIEISFEAANTSLYNLPSKAYNADTTDWNQAAENDLYPNTKMSYPLGTETFTCIPDTPFVQHPILECEPTYNRTAYYVFTLTQPSFISFQGIPSKFITKVYPFNALTEATSFLTVEPIYPCLSNNYRQICGLDPGIYTLVVFADDEASGSTITPIITVDKLGTARFDHTQNAYDFAEIRDDGAWYNGKLGDIHPLNDSLAPSNDIIYCSTGAQPDDPTNGVCNSGYNQAIYTTPLLYQDTLPQKGHSLRNVWHTFTLSGAGRATVKINHYNQSRPLMAVYQSDVDATIPFEDLQQNGGIDSTLVDGLEFLTYNFVRCSRDRVQEISFVRSGCQPTPNRYFILTTQWHTSEPNQPIDIEIKYEGESVPPAQYDHYSTVNVINGMNQTTAPYDAIDLGDGKYQGAPMSFQCVTRDEGDPFSSTCYNRSVWYKFQTQTSGQVRIAFEDMNDATNKGRNGNMRLYKEEISGDSTSLVLIDQQRFSRNNALNDSGHEWNEACFSPGTYYIFWVACNDEFDIFGTYRPLIWLYRNEGDFCSTAIPFNLNGIGSADTSLRIDCHTIGEGFGEDGSNMGCLFGPEAYKSSWFKLTLTGDEKVDVTFNLRENTTAFPSQIRYRILYGTCTAITSGPCNTDANTVFTLNCMTAGDYFVQVVTPSNATGSLDVAVSSVITPDEFCKPLEPLEPNANFTYENDCQSDTIFFQNKSSAGEDISYLWQFPDGSTSSATDPFYVHPRVDTFQRIDIGLIVSNDSLNLKDSVQIPIFILPTVNIFADAPALACNGDTSILDVSYPNATYVWQDGTTEPTYAYSEPGLYWVEVTVFGCSIRDSVEVLERTCVFTTIDTSFCQNLSYEGNFYQSDTTFEEVYVLPNEIDSIVTTNIFLYETAESEQSIAVCSGESIQVGNSFYSQTGTYTDVFFTSNQCDSTVTTHLVVHPLPNPDILGAKSFCETDSIFLFVAGNYDQYLWAHSGDTTNGVWVKQGNDYEVTVVDSNRCSGTANILIAPPITINSTIEVLSDYNGFSISCQGFSNGEAVITPNGGIEPYQYLWTDRQKEANATNLTAGTYEVTITDQIGCTTTNEIILNEPALLEADLMPFPVRCYGEQNGAISIAIAGATAPYEFSLNNQSFTPNNLFENITAGTYEVAVKDNNNCLWNGEIAVTEPDELQLDIEPNYMEISLGDSIELEAITNALGINTLRWTPNTYMSCDTCISMIAKPFTTVTYTAELMDAAGCMATSEATLRVSTDDRVYVPNVFSPTGNNENNQRFTVFAGPEVQLIHSLIIVNRWGELMYEQYDFPPNDPTIGWDGQFKGQTLTPAVFGYAVEIELINGVRKRVKGDLTLIR